MGGWPQPGRCGACGRPARRFPSGRWEHDGRPCALRSRSLWSPTDDAPPCVFVPAGEELPQPDGIRLEPRSEAGAAYPTSLEIRLPTARATWWDTVRERLAADAEAAS